MSKGILSAIGNTPLVKLSKIFRDAPFEVFAKLEAFNPGGSMKDRAAFSMLERAMTQGRIGPNTVIIESSSGNMAIGLAQACAYFGLQFICVVDPKTTPQNIKILKAYGAQIDLVPAPDPRTGEYLQARLDRVQELLRHTPDSFGPDQYSNVYNPMAHHQTMHEIVTKLGRGVDYLFCATSTCGTMRGCAEYVAANGLGTKIIAVDAVGSVIFGGPAGKRLIPGHGAATRPRLYQPGLAATCMRVTDLDCVVGCRRLVREEAILAGGSSGAVLMAVTQMREQIPDGATCAVIFADRGERYLDTIYSEAWVMEHFGDVSYLWETAAGDPVSEGGELPMPLRVI